MPVPGARCAGKCLCLWLIGPYLVLAYSQLDPDLSEAGFESLPDRDATYFLQGACPSASRTNNLRLADAEGCIGTGCKSLIKRCDGVGLLGDLRDSTVRKFEV